MLKKSKMRRESVFVTAGDLQCEYSYAEVYLGAKAKITFAKSKTTVDMSYSVRDGILVKIKRSEPYRVLFDYIDGTYIVNDDGNREYDQLVNALQCMKEEAGKYQHLSVYEKLETVMYKFLAINFGE
jgi:hypothetical protein